jgi:hypothetical protein
MPTIEPRTITMTKQGETMSDSPVYAVYVGTPPPGWTIACSLCQEPAGANSTRCQKCRELSVAMRANPGATARAIAAQLEISEGDIEAGLAGRLQRPTATSEAAATFISMHVPPGAA